MYSRRDYGLSRAYNVRATKRATDHKRTLIGPDCPRFAPREDYNSLAPGQLIEINGAGCRI